jgi:phage gpG-like protein
MINITVTTGTIYALSAASNRVKKAIRDVDDRRQLLQEIKEGQAERWLDDFLAGGNPTWEPTSRSYRQRRRQEGFSETPTLIRTGRTLAHFASQNQDAAIGAASVRWDFQNAEGAYTVSHNEGYQLGPATVPSRRLWEFHPRDQDIIASQIEEWFAKKLGDLF